LSLSLYDFSECCVDFISSIPGRYLLYLFLIFFTFFNSFSSSSSQFENKDNFGFLKMKKIFNEIERFNKEYDNYLFKSKRTDNVNNNHRSGYVFQFSSFGAIYPEWMRVCSLT
jgi:hypothetical protein